MLAPEQSRAARAWLDWSQEELAKRSQVALSTVRDFEKGRRTPISNNMAAILAALKHGGVAPVFDEQDRPLGITSRLGASS